VLEGDKYVMGTAVTLTTFQLAQVIGFAAGGAITGFLGTGRALVIDAATFAGSAIIVRLWVRRRPAMVTEPAREGRSATSTGSGLLVTFRMVFGNTILRTSMLFGWLSAFYNAPEGVMTPLAHSLGHGATAVGVLLAAQATGEMVGAIVFSRFVVPASRLRMMGPLAVGTCMVLVLFFVRPGLTVSLMLLVASGLCASYQLAANAAFVGAVRPERRSQAFGLAQGGMSLGQGTVMIAAGALAQALNPASVIAICGCAGAVVAVVLAVGWANSRRRESVLPGTRY
jgi:hypothetical protein